MIYNVTRIPRLTKTPTQKFAWHHTRVRILRVHVHARDYTIRRLAAVSAGRPVPADEDQSQDA